MDQPGGSDDQPVREAERELTMLEEQGWQALATSGEAATLFYSRVLDETVVMLLPGGLLLDDRAEIINSMSGQPWSSYELSDMRVLRPAPDTAVVAYAVTAERPGTPTYSALVSSVYVRRADGWKLTLHQHTPR